MFEELLNLPGADVWLLEDPAEGFHAKGYLFRQAGGATAIVGNSNLRRRHRPCLTERAARFRS